MPFSARNAFGTSIVTGAPSTFLGAFLEGRQLNHVARLNGLLPTKVFDFDALETKEVRITAIKDPHVDLTGLACRLSLIVSRRTAMSELDRRGTAVWSWPRRGSFVPPGELAAEVRDVQESETELERAAVSQYASRGIGIDVAAAVYGR